MSLKASFEIWDALNRKNPYQFLNELELKECTRGWNKILIHYSRRIFIWFSFYQRGFDVMRDLRAKSVFIEEIQYPLCAARCWMHKLIVMRANKDPLLSFFKQKNYSNWIFCQNTHQIKRFSYEGELKKMEVKLESFQRKVVRIGD